MIGILNNEASKILGSSTNGVEEETGKCLTCNAAQINTICNFVEYPTDNEQFSEIQQYVKSELSGCSSLITEINSTANKLGLEPYIHNYVSYQELLERPATRDFIESHVRSILDNKHT